MKVIALSQLTGTYGNMQAGQEFEVSDELGAELLRLGHVRQALRPAVAYETKVVVPQPPESERLVVLIGDEPDVSHAATVDEFP